MATHLEVRVRPFSNPSNQERPDHRGNARVHVSREVLLDLKIESGQPCYLWKVSEGETSRRMAVAWLTAERLLSKKVVQISRSFQDACGFKIGDYLFISAAEHLQDAASIVLRDVSESVGEHAVMEMKEEDRSHWEWFLREYLGRGFSLTVRVSSLT